ncbi:hypothetical protein KOR42_05260 [Thalassoglobus neptunius]|uniref:Uncharacterized protein n=1 Tax=Thalassoglobus neptunius TaxID=1938619 RepID=A0A5C5X2Z9_9PLAN|nr:hypothetical protein KOR42_05260 [Thalassoglobus neptunius]
MPATINGLRWLDLSLEVIDAMRIGRRELKVGESDSHVEQFRSVRAWMVNAGETCRFLRK